ncbi:LysR family transcriptional regulator [Metabacillus rhizolycopersici]|uniref:LysR family transcriptional regulator n=1 Tax=Metabacillus rhizolycopersici TaxID=2875709 RepID=A0ABS7V145_9BACI|nr:LysR family transcriptional regulator [Metabacillus rhizolycopersici]MBZ5753917.1 LysR family transcriptional regulator [Metabacillus rhizolycopersici]
MEWQQIEYFQVVARLQHITRAAEILLISQPALSRSIARLEEELGVPLFERQGRSISLNSYGQLFLQRADRIMKEFQDGKQEIQDLLDPDYGNVSFGFMPTLGTYLIPNLINSFRSNYPNINFQFKQNGNDLLLKQLDSGEIDFCLVSSIESKDQFQWIQLWREELFLIVPSIHHLAKHESITLQEIADEPFVLLEKGNGLRGITDQLFEEAGITPKITFEGEEVHTVAAFVAAGLGVTIIPEFKGIDWNNITRIRLRAPNSQRVIGLAWVEGRYLSPAAKRFQQFILNYFKK